LIRHADGRRHGGFPPASAVLPLTIPVVGPAIIRLLMLAIRDLPLPPPRSLTAGLTAITVSSITIAANMKNDSTANTPALEENSLGMFTLHPRSIADWTSGQPS